MDKGLTITNLLNTEKELYQNEAKLEGKSNTRTISFSLFFFSLHSLEHLHHGHFTNLSLSGF